MIRRKYARQAILAQETHFCNRLLAPTVKENRTNRRPILLEASTALVSTGCCMPNLRKFS
jgi:hypothetical protein